jgi:nucleotide-binding universal stress UspA family protein
MLSTILVALDGSALAATALGPACRLAQQTGARLVLLRAAPHTQAAQAAAIPRQIALREARGYLDSVADRLREEGFRVQIDVSYGDAPSAIRDTARRHKADLIVVGTHGRTGLRRLVLGSVTEQVILDTAASVLVVHAGERVETPTAPLRKVLVPLDGTEYAESALAFLLDAGLAADAELILLRVVPCILPPVGVPGLVDLTAQQLLEEERMAMEQSLVEAHHYLDAVARHHLRGKMCYPMARADYPARAIVHVAEAEGVDLIAMATHRHTGMDRLLHASVTAHVLHHTRVPVLVVHHTRVPVLVVHQPVVADAGSPAGSQKHVTAIQGAAGGAALGLMCRVDGED